MQNINSDNNTIEIKTKSERISKTPDRYKLENTQNSNCQTEIKEILDTFNQKFVKQDYPILQTPPRDNEANNSDATTKEPIYDTPSSSQGKNTENNNSVEGNPSDMSATPTNLNSYLNSSPTKGGKKKTRRKGRTKKKTKTRKK